MDNRINISRARPAIGRTFNPEDPKCPLHLRRCCGVCVHFGDDIIRTTAVCSKLAVARRGSRNARDCEYWERKSQGASKVGSGG